LRQLQITQKNQSIKKFKYLKKNPAKAGVLNKAKAENYSHSIVAGGLPEIS
jgi:hypothetical protein